MSNNMKQVSDGSFETDVLGSPIPVLVDFWAPWCGPCKFIAPVLEELANEYSGRVAFAKVNTDENQAIAMKFGIRSIPTLMLFKGGRLVDTRIGAMPKPQIKSFLDGNL